MQTFTIVFFFSQPLCQNGQFKVLYCKCFTFGHVFSLAFFAEHSIMYVHFTYRNTLNQIKANLLQRRVPQNIMQTNYLYSTFTIYFFALQQNTIQLPPGVQIPPGAQLVRNEQGQLVFVIQQPAATSATTGHRMFVRQVRFGNRYICCKHF